MHRSAVEGAPGIRSPAALHEGEGCIFAAIPPHDRAAVPQVLRSAFGPRSSREIALLDSPQLERPNRGCVESLRVTCGSPPPPSVLASHSAEWKMLEVVWTPRA